MSPTFYVNALCWGRTFAGEYGPDPDHANGPFHGLTMMGAIGAMCRGYYFHGLTQYGAGKVSMHRLAITEDDPPSQWSSGAQADGFTEQDIVNYIVRELDAGRVPPPSDFVEEEHPMYVVVLPQGLFSKDHFYTAVGLHWTFDYRGHRAPCAWVMQGGSLHDTTSIVAHEIVEIISSELDEGEIADDCNDMTALLDGVMVQGYKSRIDGGACVIPGLVTTRPPWRIPQVHTVEGLAELPWKGND